MFENEIAFCILAVRARPFGQGERLVGQGSRLMAARRGWRGASAAVAVGTAGPQGVPA